MARGRWGQRRLAWTILADLGRSFGTCPWGREGGIATPRRGVLPRKGGEVEIVDSRPLGDTLVLDQLWREQGIHQSLKQLLAGRRLDPRVDTGPGSLRPFANDFGTARCVSKPELARSSNDSVQPTLPACESWPRALAGVW